MIALASSPVIGWNHIGPHYREMEFDSEDVPDARLGETTEIPRVNITASYSFSELRELVNSNQVPKSVYNCPNHNTRTMLVTRL